jgi:hypothetical protein
MFPKTGKSRVERFEVCNFIAIKIMKIEHFGWFVEQMAFFFNEAAERALDLLFLLELCDDQLVNYLPGKVRMLVSRSRSWTEIVLKAVSPMEKFADISSYVVR